MVNLTNDEQQIMRHYILLIIARKALESDLLLLEKTKLRLQTTFTEMTISLLNQISKELAPVKKEMTKLNMIVEKKQNDGLFTEFTYICRGYHGSMRILNAHLKKQVFDYITSCFTTVNLMKNKSV